MAFNIVLYEPEIPNNTGNIGRLSLATGCRLHLIKPYGFDINESRVRRAGLDYWKHVDLHEYDSFDEFIDKCRPETMIFFSAHGQKSYIQGDYSKNDYLIFGKESVGLPQWIKEKYLDHMYQIPLYSEHIRSLNLANSVAVVVFEGLRQIGMVE